MLYVFFFFVERINEISEDVRGGLEVKGSGAYW